MKDTRIPGRTEEERIFDMRILCELALVWILYHPADEFTWQDNRWMEVMYYRRKWRKLCEAR